MSILEKIIERKKEEVHERKSLYSQKFLEQRTFFETKTVSLKKYLLRKDKSGIIAEIKRKSPSRGTLNPAVSIERTSIGYMQAGASALSILTDKDFFGGSNEDLTVARKFNYCPILRKDFIIDEYQIIEAKSIGADAILMIAAAISPAELRNLAAFAKSLGLETLMEVHNQEELDRSLNEHVDLVGVNNRDLATFEVDLSVSYDLANTIPAEFTKVSESGLRTPDQIVALKSAGYDGFLIGEQFMRENRPEKACARFIEKLSQLEKTAYAKQ